MRRLGALLATTLALLSVGIASAASLPTIEVGRSVEGRPIEAVRAGSAAADRLVLVVGEIHGNEVAGRAVTRRLRKTRPPHGTAFVLVDDANPDGAAASTRWNARGVDLNRNWPFAWRPIGRPFETYHSGSGPLSEPESAAMSKLIQRLRPRVTIWFHQNMRLVDPGGGDRALERLYARVSKLPYRRIPPLPGTATRWQSSTFPRDTAFVVELPAGRLDARSIIRHTRAVTAVAKAIAPPHVIRNPIPFGAERKAQMRAYARRHYGIDEFRLRRPQVIVQHFTASNSFSSAFNTFAANQPDVELGERPGVCAHYLIDRDGSIHRLVPTSIMCRHTVGLNWTAIGIEHVGVSDGQVLGNRRQLRASLRLTRMLQGRHRIKTRYVIGHAESLSSPLHRERVARLRTQTHGDFAPSTARRYRRALSRLPAPSSMR